MDFPFKMVDLTHALSQQCPSWEGDCGFQHETLLDYSSCSPEVTFRVQKINMYAGIGTHLDAPAHCFPNGKTVDQIALQELVAPCRVIDISNVADATYVLPAETILAHENKQGPIRASSFIIIRTGWDKHWYNPNAYRNHLQFPSISKEAAALLLERNIIGLGVDTLSPDVPQSGYIVHKMILGTGKYLIENIANAHKLPVQGSFIMALPILVEKATEAPIRLVGLIPK